MNYFHVESLKNDITKWHKRDLLDRDSNRDPDHYWVNSVHVSHNGNSSDDTDDPTNLGDGSLCRIF